MQKEAIEKVLDTDYFKEIRKQAAILKQPTFVIGGFVRDFLLQKKDINDIDIVTEGNGILLAKAVQKNMDNVSKLQIFKTYGTAMIQVNNITLEFVGARKESYSNESRNPKVFKGTIADDQKRRDFTINALAISLNKKNYGELIDPFNGINDLKNKIIRTPLNPERTYSDDPLRIFRAIRFATQLDFSIEKKSLDAITKQKDRVAIITKERIIEELNKIISTPTPSKGFLLLESVCLLEKILPELTALKGIEEIDNQKHKDNFYHTLEVVDNISKYTDNLWLRWAALLHDIGKEPTKKFDKKNGWTFYGHEFVGAKMVYKTFQRLKMPLNKNLKYIQKMIEMSARPIALVEDFVNDSAIRRFIFDAGEHMEDLMTLCEADITTKNPIRFKRYHENFKNVRAKIKQVEERDRVRKFQPPITGNIIMQTFNIRPSKEIAIIKKAIKDAILEGEIPNEYDAAYQMMLTLGKKMGLKK